MRLIRAIQLRRLSLTLAGLAFAPPPLALAHPGQPLAPHDLWRAWSFEPALFVGLALLAACYARGVRALWRRAGYGRGLQPWRVAACAGGALALLTALASPLDALSGALFAAHMGQHMLLVLVAAPLLCLGMPALALLWALPVQLRPALRGWRVVRPAWGALASLPSAWLLHAAALWLWHVPGFYQVALRDEQVHMAEHASLLGTAALFWWALLRPAGAARSGGRVLALFLFAGQASALGGLLLAARAPWYPAYAGQTTRWGLAPLEDQQLAALIMTLPSDLIYLLAALALFARCLRYFEAPRTLAALLPREGK